MDNNSIKDQSTIEDISKDKAKKKKTKILWIIIFVVVNAVVITSTAISEFSNRPPEKLDFEFGISNYIFILCGIGCVALALFIETVKYMVMMRDLGEKISLKTAFQTAALGKYYDNITPSGVGGQPFQIYNMYSEGYSSGASAAMPLTAFLTMQLGFIILAIFVMIFKGHVISDLTGIKIVAYIGVVCYMIVPAVIIMFTISKKTATRLITGVIKIAGKTKIIKNVEATTNSILKSVNEYYQSIILMSKKKWLLIKLFLLSFIYQISICSIPFFVLLAYNGHASYIECLSMTVFIYCAITIIPTPGNAGAAEGSFYLIFSQLNPTGLFWSMLIWRILCYYSFIVVGIGIYGQKVLTKRKERLLANKRK